MRFKITAAVLFPLMFAASVAAQPIFDEDYERLLLPVFIGNTPGPFGSLFASSLTVWNRSTTENIRIWGLEEHCNVPVICPLPDPAVPVVVKPYGAEGVYFVAPLIIPNGNPGRFVYVPQAE